jgi:glycosyltransferase involved in cell wall biosynthesis
MGVDTDRYRPARPDAPDGRILFLGRLVEKKGAIYLIEAFAKVQRRFPHATLQVAGNGPLRGELEARAAALGVAGSTSFLGEVSEAAKLGLLRGRPVFVLPSVVARSGDVDGLPVTLLEAMAAGCPVLTTDAGGIRDLVDDGRNGLLARQRDAASLADGLETLLADAGKAHGLAEAGLRTAQAFDWKQVAARHVHEYRGG